HIAALAQHDGGGSVVALVVVVDEVGLFGEGVEVVGPAGLQKDLALCVGGLGADEVPHVIKADGEMLAVGGLDLYRLAGDQGLLAGCLKLGRCRGGAGGSACSGGGGGLSVACECHGMYFLYLCPFVAYLMEPKRKPRSAAAALNQATSSGVNSTQNRYRRRWGWAGWAKVWSSSVSSLPSLVTKAPACAAAAASACIWRSSSVGGMT